MIWDEVYQRTDVSRLPWHGIPFIDKVKHFLNGIDKSSLIIVPGCGVGDTVDQLRTNGYENVIGTDISSVAIAKAQERFHHSRFYCVPTEALSKRDDFRNAHVIDWLNLHQISPRDLPAYLVSLETISSSLFLVYFYDSKRAYSQKSMITGEFVYNHNPDLITRLLRDLKKTREFVFYTDVNKEFDRSNQNWRTIAQTYFR